MLTNLSMYLIRASTITLWEQQLESYFMLDEP